MANKYMKQCSKSLAIKKIQLTTILLIAVSCPSLRKQRINAGEEVGKAILIYCR
jgi:hypothetical protein